MGHQAENPATLTAHDWITTGSTPWNHAAIRDGMTGEKNTGFWNVKVVEEGEYEIRLRRWPIEADAAIDAGLAAGAEVPGERAFCARDGRALPLTKATITIGEQTAEMPVPRGQKKLYSR